MAERLALIATSLDYEALSGADIVVEAAFENLALKKEIFTRLDRVAKPGAILGTNTSSLDIDEIAAVTGRPQDVIGLHFFSPANVMRLLEIVQAKRTAPDVLVTALEMARAIKKVGVVAKVCYGFIGNRMMEAYGREAERCVMEGATPADVDGAMEDFGMAMGLLAVFDLAGVDIGHLMRAERAHLLPDDPTFYRPSALLTERGWLGQKSGRGYYRYDNPERRRTPDPESVALFRAEAQRLGVPQRKPSQPGDPGSLPVRARQRGRAHPRGRRRAACKRHRHRLYGRLWFPTLPRRPDVLRRLDGTAGGLRKDARTSEDAW